MNTSLRTEVAQLRNGELVAEAIAENAVGRSLRTRRRTWRPRRRWRPVLRLA
jgi:hypothetical protein